MTSSASLPGTLVTWTTIEVPAWHTPAARTPERTSGGCSSPLP